MARQSVVIRLAGESGEGVISSGDILTQAAARGGYWTQTFRTYPAEIKGGPCMYQVRMGQEKIYSHGKLVDLLVCFNQEAWDLHWESLAPDGVILYDGRSSDPIYRAGQLPEYRNPEWSGNGSGRVRRSCSG